MSPASCLVVLGLMLGLGSDALNFKVEVSDDHLEPAAADLAGLQSFFNQISNLDEPTNGDCNCIKLTCSCCTDISIHQLHFKEKVCVELTYLPSEIGAHIAIKLDNTVLFQATFSLKNPKPLCFDIKKVSACLNIHNLDFSNHQISGCVQLELKFSFLKKSFELGCFHIPLADDQIEAGFASVIKEIAEMYYVENV
jgi:hypothetical protein